MAMKCYNCGKEINCNITHEHIPAKALFEGYDSQHKNNIITVPACFDCNNSYSSTDEEFRNLIGIITKQEQNDVLTKKTVKSILRKKDWNKMLFSKTIGNIDGVKFSEGKIEEFHKKNFKGIYYHQCGFPLPNSYDILVNINEDDKSQATLFIINYLKKNFEWKISGHEDIFKFCMQPIREEVIYKKSEEKHDFKITEDEPLIACLMVYNQEHAALVYGVRKDYMERIVKEHNS